MGRLAIVGDWKKHSLEEHLFRVRLCPLCLDRGADAPATPEVA
jgi:hypothetical protein